MGQRRVAEIRIQLFDDELAPDVLPRREPRNRRYTEAELAVVKESHAAVGKANQAQRDDCGVAINELVQVVKAAHPTARITVNDIWHPRRVV